MFDNSEPHAREEGLALTPRFDDAGLLPAVVTDAASETVLMLAWMNAEALGRTIETGEAWFWSRSRQCLWHKGATSGQVQLIEEIRVDCDQDTIWLTVRMPRQPGCCHTGRSSCFYRRVVSGPSGPMLALDPVALGHPAERG
jgi:phosphoribosyl-AMP cyclohydrolase